MSLHIRLYILLGLLFGLLYAALTVVGTRIGITSFYFYAIFCAVLLFVQYMIGPRIVEWSMRVKYIESSQYPRLHKCIESLAQKARIPKPRIGVAQISIPNAFAFGRGPSDGRVCVTEGILQLLNEEELTAVLAHEVSHIKNRDVLTITLLSVIPMLMYRLAWHLLWFGGTRRRGSGSNSALIGLAAFLLYFITNLLVLYGSRIREYFADRGAIKLGARPEALASALYKLVYGSARMSKASIKDVEGLKAFFVNDPSRAHKEIQELAQIDLDKSGTIDSYELAALRSKKIDINFKDKMFEALSTHPNMLKRIKRLSTYS
jgi:heat shock protein HtpX